MCKNKSKHRGAGSCSACNAFILRCQRCLRCTSVGYDLQLRTFTGLFKFFSSSQNRLLGMLRIAYVQAIVNYPLNVNGVLVLAGWSERHIEILRFSFKFKAGIFACQKGVASTVS